MKNNKKMSNTTKQGVVNLAGSVNGKRPGPKYCWHDFANVYDQQLGMPVRKCNKCEFKDVNIRTPR